MNFAVLLWMKAIKSPKRLKGIISDLKAKTHCCAYAPWQAHHTEQGEGFIAEIDVDNTIIEEVSNPLL